MFKSIIKILSIMLFSGIFVAGCFTLKYDTKGGVSIDPRIKTFSVQYFDNRATLVQPSFSQTFTEGLRDYIEKNTSLRYVTGVGDVDFSGQITTYEITPQAVTSANTAAQTRFTIGVKVKYTNNYDSKSSFEKSFSSYRDYNSTESFASVESGLSEVIMQEVIEQTYNAAFINW
jgi:hypothetical protein